MKNMQITLWWFIWMSIALVILVACSGKKSPKALDELSMSSSMDFPDFNPDSAYCFIAEQLHFGPRIPASKAHEQCAAYLQKTIENYADTVYVQEFSAKRWDGQRLTGKNIIASFNPEQSRRVLLAAHWDSRPYADRAPDPTMRNQAIDGANDGASGVGVLMEIARVLKEEGITNIGVDIIFFDLEDSGAPEWEKTSLMDDWCLGAQYWASHPHINGYKANYGVLLDMVAYKNSKFTKEGTSLYYAPDILEKVWNIAKDIGYAEYFLFEETPPIVDDHLFVNKIAGIPMIDIVHFDRSTEHGFFPYWHTNQDNLEKIDKKSLEAVGEVLIALLYNENK